MKAVIVRKTGENTRLAVEDVAVPEVGPDQVLIRNKVLGLNPTDWKHAKGISLDGSHLGCDGTGIIENVGLNVKDIANGSRRGYFLRGGINKENAAFADFTVIDAELTFEVPEAISFEQAATLPIPFFTAIQALYQRLELPEPTNSAKENSDGKWILIYSGGTTVGQYAIQLARLSGLRVITTASASRTAELKALGATTVIDYRASNVTQQLKEATHDNIVYALDCYGDEGTSVSYNAISDTTGGKVVTILPFNPSDYTRKDVSIVRTIVYSALNYEPEDIHFGPYVFHVSPGDRTFLVKWYKRYPELLTTLGIKFTDTDRYEGLEKVEEALEILSSGKVAGKKLIVTL